MKRVSNRERAAQLLAYAESEGRDVGQMLRTALAIDGYKSTRVQLIADTLEMQGPGLGAAIALARFTGE